MGKQRSKVPLAGKGRRALRVEVNETPQHAALAVGTGGETKGGDNFALPGPTTWIKEER